MTMKSGSEIGRAMLSALIITVLEVALMMLSAVLNP